MDRYTRDGLVFDVRDAGPPEGPVVVLLHGFPQRNDSWNAVIDRLTAAGYRCLAPNQRGYSPGARPRRRRDYRMSELVADVAALIDASGAQRVHLVGHDWGAAVAWGVAAELPERLATVSPVSVPHPAAFLKSFVTSSQGLASWYMGFFQLPWLPEWLLTRRQGALAAKSLRRSGQTTDAAQRDVRAMTEPGALTGGLNWYRGMPLSNLGDSNQQISVPTMYVWSDHDMALKPKAAHDTARYVDAAYRFEVLEGVSHWIPDTEPDRLADLLLDWFAAHPTD
ncbi:alpha/beta fold hydrolase [Mycolicibacter hiberniae]|uniref:Alpha/beta hydrolase n=1 Tax=Mycolicibacter hiberniae TaxID=29314 RepID=A0A7I7X525_9MYCO|nr:alpha/beta fold hydrolase [Mycolicibacter hiberniae]MCV7086300.1 alpha/beta fold hydrolase [Mycolicibacter hiberniae]ORV69607.1 alpha/beta hydrolase [Mycolicibacter hiberniae]BBZ24542.1 alpha/beta hydrolase [Mycolicibacter hiberniae]